jgi:hypothetical protein
MARDITHKTRNRADYVLSLMCLPACLPGEVQRFQGFQSTRPSLLTAPNDQPFVQNWHKPPTSIIDFTYIREV